MPAGRSQWQGAEVIRIYLLIGALAALLAEGWYLHHSGYTTGVAHERAAWIAKEAEASAKAQKQAVQADAASKVVTDKGSQAVAQNEQATHETVRTITKIVHDHPSAPACVLPPDSVSTLQRAADSANAAASQLQ